MEADTGIATEVKVVPGEHPLVHAHTAPHINLDSDIDRTTRMKTALDNMV